MGTGKIIVLEGLDGSGKTVQFGLLRDYLQASGIKLATADFPDYQSFYGKLVGRYLDGELGDKDNISPYFSALPYAGDRALRRPQLLQWKADGYVVLLNRYVGSNVAYHSVKLPPEERPAFIAWLKELEYEVNGIPREDLVIYLDNNVSTAQKMVDQKAERSYTAKRRDVHESDADFLHKVANQYLSLCDSEPHWVRLEVIDPQNEDMLSPQIIHHKVLSLLHQRGIIEQESGVRSQESE